MNLKQKANLYLNQFQDCNRNILNSNIICAKLLINEYISSKVIITFSWEKKNYFINVAISKASQCFSFTNFQSDNQQRKCKTIKQSLNQYQQSQQHMTNSQKKRPLNFIELESQKDPQLKYKYPIFTDNQVGIKLEYQKLLQQTYDNDDDINTRESVMQYFIEICRQDLIQGMKQNQKIYYQNRNPIINFAGLQNRLRDQYNSIGNDSI
ncbi:unnamed protein product [Paramecium sonneborni]|uniref:Uncharacterized protein n=1 Tax=Paramecium sonneborni TaxID=65129 RepID=A0A8S1PR57_9CILI|nr:unnamed protein product [Paramecium sonneborni]